MIDIDLVPAWVKALLLAVLVTLAFGSGWAVNGLRLGAAASRLETQQQTQRTAALNDALQLLASTRQTNAALAANLAASETARTQLAEEKTDAIRRLTTGRRCLDGAAVRVLNRTASQPAGVPAAGPEPVPAAAAFATDTDVGHWIGICQHRFATCNARLEALSSFYQRTPESD